MESGQAIAAAIASDGFGSLALKRVAFDFCNRKTKSRLASQCLQSGHDYPTEVAAFELSGSALTNSCEWGRKCGPGCAKTSSECEIGDFAHLTFLQTGSLNKFAVMARLVLPCLSFNSTTFVRTMTWQSKIGFAHVDLAVPYFDQNDESFTFACKSFASWMTERVKRCPICKGQWRPHFFG